MSEQVRKRKQPPTFQHYPVEQARKLKKAWIQKTLIKSKWKAEKKKLQAEGILSPSAKSWEIQDPTEAADQNDRDEVRSVSESEDLPPRKRSKPSEQPQDDTPYCHLPSLSDDGQKPLPKQVHSEPPMKVASMNRGRGPSWKAKPRPSKGQPKGDYKGKSTANPQDNGGDEPLSLRDLKREAYSNTVLHTYKADPLHKHGPREGQFYARGRGARSGPGRDTCRTRGQPNMKLRMGFMLEKIKRDLNPSP